MNEQKLVRTAVRAIITDNEGRILILQRSNSDFCSGWWNLPGGKIDFNQTAQEAVIREIEEETSLKCINSRFLFYMDNLPAKEYNSHFLTMFFHCQCEGTVKINEESADFYWIDKSELGSHQLAFEHDTAIKKYWNYQ